MHGNDDEVASLERTIKDITKKYGEVCEKLGTSRQRCDAFERFVSFVAHEYTVLISQILATAEAELRAMGGAAPKTFEIHYGSEDDCRDVYAVIDAESKTLRVFYITRGCQSEISILPPAAFTHYAGALEIAADAFNNLRLVGDERFSLAAFAGGRDCLSTLALDIAGTMFDAYIQARRLETHSIGGGPRTTPTPPATAARPTPPESPSPP